jgi:hypothetical protein
VRRIDDAVRFALSGPDDRARQELERSLGELVVGYADGLAEPHRSAALGMLARWATARFPSLPEPLRRRVAAHVLERAPERTLGLDPLDVALQHVESWRTGARARQDGLVCPLAWSPASDRGVSRTGPTDRPFSLPSAGYPYTDCTRPLASIALANERAYMPRLLSYLRQVRDAELAQAVFATVRGPENVAMLRALDGDPRLLDAVLVGMGAIELERRSPFWDERIRLWNERPGSRSSLLLGMALAGFLRQDFEQLASMTPGRATSRDAAQILGASGTVRILPTIWPMFERGAIGARELAPVLESTPAHVYARPALHEIARLLCEEQRREDLRALQRTYLDLRARAPQDGLGDFVEAFDPARCPAPSRLTKPAAELPPRSTKAPPDSRAGAPNLLDGYQ